MNVLRPKNVLISVYRKDGLSDLLCALNTLDITIYSTGGTADTIQQLGYSVRLIEELTGFPSMLGGRVKTLHPKVFGGVLARRNNAADLSEINEYSIPLFDWVIVDLYPFEQYLNFNNGHKEQLEHIDIGGVSLIRAAAKNYLNTLIISDIEQYPDLQRIIQENQGSTSQVTRLSFAQKAFSLTARYDQLISHYLCTDVDPNYLALKYGENPHQKAQFIGNLFQYFEFYGDKQPSYNNLVDLEAGLQVIAEFEEPTFAIIKHMNTCGLASDYNLDICFARALACDPMSAFGGVFVTNQKINLNTAEEIDRLFYEVLVAPDYSDQALDLLAARKNRLILKNLKQEVTYPVRSEKSVLDGILVQDLDLHIELPEQWNTVTTIPANSREIEDALFALKSVKHLKSNAIALVKNKQLIGMGCGQTSRITALEQAISKAELGEFDLTGAVMASDAFFPFSDCVERAAKVGVKTIIQPGGSRRDRDSIVAAEQLKVTLILTGIRHFKH